jgi:hypothetical protein
MESFISLQTSFIGFWYTEDHFLYTHIIFSKYSTRDELTKRTQNMEHMSPGEPGMWLAHVHRARTDSIISNVVHWARVSVGGNRARRVDADTTALWTHSLPSLSLARFLLLLLLERGKETQKLTKTEQGKYSANRRPKNWQRPSVLSSYYRVSVSLQGVHYL